MILAHWASHFVCGSDAHLSSGEVLIIISVGLDLTLALALQEVLTAFIMELLYRKGAWSNPLI